MSLARGGALPYIATQHQVGTTMSATTSQTFENDYAAGQSDERPWGSWAVLAAGPGFAVKRIKVIPGGILSLQRHQHRAEQWTVVAGTARVTRNDETFDLTAGQSVAIGLHDIHRVANPGTVDMEFIEVQTGRILRETDIERLQDTYGRS